MIGVEEAVLKPCPFCGGEAVCSPAFETDEQEPEDREPLSWAVGCDCTAFVGPWATEAEAITAWNTREGGRTAQHHQASMEKGIGQWGF